MSSNFKVHESLYGKSRADRSGTEAVTSDKAIRRALERLMKNKFVPEPGRILELGCGTGGTALRLREEGWEVHGVDKSAGAIRRARKKAGSTGGMADFRVGNAAFLRGFESGSFDLVLDCRCLQHMIGEDRARCLKSAYRVLRPGGCLIVHTTCGPRVSTSIAGYDSESCCQMVNGTAVRYFGRPREITEEIEAAGFLIAKRELHDATDEDDQDCTLIAALRPLVEPDEHEKETAPKRGRGGRWTNYKRSR
jgi:SAM-dependent methyltransferase